MAGLEVAIPMWNPNYAKVGCAGELHDATLEGHEREFQLMGVGGVVQDKW
jgi:hypothetical protein